MPLVSAPEQPAPLRLRSELVNDLVETAGNPSKHDIEAAGGLGPQPLLHLARDRCRSADEGEARIASCGPREHPDRQTFLPGEIDHALALPATDLSLRDIRQRTIGIVTGHIKPEH